MPMNYASIVTAFYHTTDVTSGIQDYVDSGTLILEGGPGSYMDSFGLGGPRPDYPIYLTLVICNSLGDTLIAILNDDEPVSLDLTTVGLS
jgi:hypothetical protein